jgi:hypothetical protein
MKTVKLILLLSFILLAMAACGRQLTQNNSPTPTSIPNPEPGKATVTGKVISTTTNKPLNIPVWLAEVHRQGDQGVYLLDAVNSPSIYADDNGIFVLENVDPMEYVIIVGNPEGQNVVITDDTGKPKVWNIPGDKIFDVGELMVALSK